MMRMIMLGWMESTVVVYNRQFPITGTVPFFFQCNVAGSKVQRESTNAD